jgi:Putative lumazine-binding
MKISVRFIILMLFAGNVAFAQSEEVAIKKTVSDYLEGGTNGDVNRFKSAFVNDAVQRSVAKTGGIAGMTVESLASKIKPGTVMERSTNIVSWSYAGDAATAITETIYPTSKIIDLLNLLKVNGEWKIVSRVFSRIEKNEQVSSSSGNSYSSSNTNVSTPTAATKPKTAAPAPAKKKVISDDGWK